MRTLKETPIWLGIACAVLCGCGVGTVATDGGADLGGQDAGACGAFPTLNLTLLTKVTGPTCVTGAPGDATRLYVLEKTGRIRLVKNGTLVATPFADLRAIVDGSGADNGLLGLAFHPQYTANGRLFVHFTDKMNNSVIAELARSAGDPDVANPALTKTFFTVATPAKIRYGGDVAFGADGFLYIGLGDGSPAGDPAHTALDLTTKLGKMLRIDVDNYPTPPAGNMTGANVDPQIWDFGFREPWRFSFDRLTGDLYIAEVGDADWQEINVESAGDGRRNYGWSVTEGAHCKQPGCDLMGITQPVVEYPNATDCAVIGGYVYRGSKNSCLTGWYLFGDYCTNNIRAMTWQHGVAPTVSIVTDRVDPNGVLKGMSSFGQDADGELYVVDFGGNAVYRIDTP